MRESKNIEVGDKIDLFYDNSPDYKTIVESIVGGKRFHVVVPSIKGVPMPLREGRELKMAFYRDSGRYVVKIVVVGFKEIKRINYVIIEQISEPEKEQRRGYFRLPISLKALVCKYPEGEREYAPLMRDTGRDEVLETVRVNNISISGVSIKTAAEYTIGDRFLLKIYLNWPQVTAPPLIICAEVKRTIVSPDGQSYQAGLHFIDHNEVISEFIAKFILVQQQHQIKQRRLIEGK